MEEYRTSGKESNTVFVGVDLDRSGWQITVMTEIRSSLVSGRLSGHWRPSRSLLDRYRADPIQVVYEEAILASDFMIGW
jgi:hypothetical protein